MLVVFGSSLVLKGSLSLRRAPRERSAALEEAHETSPGDSRPGRNMARSGQTSRDGLARQVINDLNTSTCAFSVLAAALETGLLEALGESHSLLVIYQEGGQRFAYQQAEHPKLSIVKSQLSLPSPHCLAKDS